VDLLLQPTKIARETDEVDVPIQWAITIYSDTVTSDSEDSEKPKSAKPFVVHIDKVKPCLAATPKSWLAEPNLMDSDEQHNDVVIAERQLSQQEEVRLDSEVIRITSSPNSMDTYAVDEASIRTRPKRTIRPPKHLDDFRTMFA